MLNSKYSLAHRELITIGSMNYDDTSMGDYYKNMIRSLSLLYVTFMTMFVIDVNIEIFYGI